MSCGKILYMVIPCYNEQEVLPETSKRLKEKFDGLKSAGKIDEKSRIVFVNDGSRDDTWKLIKELHYKDKVYSGINLSRNRGHQNALLAGLMTAKDHADMIISMDADLQDDIDAVDGMIDKYLEGYDIVYGVRNARKKDTFFKRYTAESFYKLINSMGGQLVYNHADYRLMSRRAVEALGRYKEVNLFLRGIVPMIGYKSATVEYERGERFAGESKYPLRKMLAFAVEGITSLSVKPIRVISTVGLGIFTASMLSLIYMLLRYLNGAAVSGWAGVLASVWAVGGLVLMALGVIGEYIGKIYLEAKGRPRYIIEQFLDSESAEFEE
ncbi:MAG: glycosyltransferase [Pseudomonadota bacterium]